jgi:hypothetical protein
MGQPGASLDMGKPLETLAELEEFGLLAACFWLLAGAWSTGVNTGMREHPAKSLQRFVSCTHDLI